MDSDWLREALCPPSCDERINETSITWCSPAGQVLQDVEGAQAGAIGQGVRVELGEEEDVSHVITWSLSSLEMTGQ